ncbi:MAG: tyrosine-type recombinase/integrase [Lewinellaceae bacterium]|nr:tyrosine-type recombinase/integrase [Lewinellaceae bacterium]
MARELELLLERKERYALPGIRNKATMSLLVYQALALKEVVGLTVEDVNLEKGSIYIRASAKANARRLPLQGQQSLWLYRYLNEARPKLLKEPTPALILASRGTPERGEGIHYLVETFRPKFPTKRLTPTTIRQSVLAGLLKSGQGLRQVQAFAGHRKPSATEKYRQDNLEALKAAIDKYHPQ